MEYSSVRPSRLALSFFFDFLADARKIDKSIDWMRKSLIFTLFTLCDSLILYPNGGVEPAFIYLTSGIVFEPEYKSRAPLIAVLFPGEVMVL